MAIDQKLRQARIDAGWTRARLADESGVHHATIARIELGKSTDPGVRTVAKLEDALGLRRGALSSIESDSIDRGSIRDSADKLNELADDLRRSIGDK